MTIRKDNPEDLQTNDDDNSSGSCDNLRRSWSRNQRETTKCGFDGPGFEHDWNFSHSVH